MRIHRLALPRLVAASAAAALMCLGVPAASADAIDELGKRLQKLNGEAETLGQGIQRPKKKQSKDLQARRLIDAQVAFGVGNFDDAALMLYDFVEKNPTSRSYAEAVYYLAESLFQKGDHVAARSYFKEIVAEHNNSKFYQQSLERLIELSLKLRDGEGVDDWLQALDNVPDSQQRDSVPYVRGKYAYFSDDFAEALTHFGNVKKKSDYWFQAQYFTGASQIALGDIGKAVKTYTELVDQKPDSKDERRIVELSHMALGRLHYERDQRSKAIDEYLMISRRSDLFDEALFEVAWVYVKNAEFDKALRALELLALADPTSSKMPSVKILEGNLRIRKAQRLAEDGEGNSVEEYVKAIRVFEKTRDAFKQPFDELERILEEQEDPRIFMAQITGRESDTFDTQATIPGIAAAWLREEPDVKRVVAIETDLGQIRDEIEEAEKTIDRLEQALASPSRVNIFPSLAKKRTRATEILEDLFSMRQQLATHLRALVRKYASDTEKNELDKLQTARQEIARKLKDLPDSEVAYGERIERARDAFDDLDKKASEIQVVIDSTYATVIALEKYLKDSSSQLSAEDKLSVEEQIAELKSEIKSMRTELEAVRKEAILAKDEAGTGDEVAERAKLLRVQLRAALDDEDRYMATIIDKMSGGDRTKADQILSLTKLANSSTQTLDEANDKIDEIVDVALTEVRETLTAEKAKLGAYKREFLTYEAESRTLGGTILAQSFGEVKDKFYDVIVRSEIGVIDVTWSQKEAIDEASKRLEFDKNTEIRTLREDFRDLLEEAE